MLLSTKSNEHLKAKCFFMTERIEMGEMEVQYCPTTKMWANLINKPNQGEAFRKDRAIIMNYSQKYDNKVEHCSINLTILVFEQDITMH